MKDLIQEFKDFAFKGSIIELAVAFVLGVAFASVIGAMVDGVLMKIVAAIFSQPDFSAIDFDLGDATVEIGWVINEIVAFALVALALFLFVVKPYKAMQAGDSGEESSEPAPDPEDIVLLREIRDSLKK